MDLRFIFFFIYDVIGKVYCDGLSGVVVNNPYDKTYHVHHPHMNNVHTSDPEFFEIYDQMYGAGKYPRRINKFPQNQHNPIDIHTDHFCVEIKNIKLFDIITKVRDMISHDHFFNKQRYNNEDMSIVTSNGRQNIYSDGIPYRFKPLSKWVRIFWLIATRQTYTDLNLGITSTLRVHKDIEVGELCCYEYGNTFTVARNNLVYGGAEVESNENPLFARW